MNLPSKKFHTIKFWEEFYNKNIPKDFKEAILLQKYLIECNLEISEKLFYFMIDSRQIPYRCPTHIIGKFSIEDCNKCDDYGFKDICYEITSIPFNYFGSNYFPKRFQKYKKTMEKYLELIDNLIDNQKTFI